ncbi:hypothetical protein, partial [Bradyrhizobium sp. AC87j1]|uniref:hypothetical protein n=1 Tax=Bradyrhizobium sp. AC87j1 TaxID=2055894 RepID=UPI001AECF628
FFKLVKQGHALVVELPEVLGNRTLHLLPFDAFFRGPKETLKFEASFLSVVEFIVKRDISLYFVELFTNSLWHSRPLGLCLEPMPVADAGHRLKSSG